jgi:O2-independent ubiquinone biosynthesis accessory factor UbiT
MVMRSLRRKHPRLLPNLARLESATIHILPTDLPYGFELTVGREPIALRIIERQTSGADASVAASVATLVDLLEGRIDSDTLFFRRDLLVSGNTAVIVGLRNVLDRDELKLGDEISAAFGPLGRPSRAVARVLDRLLDGLGARLAAMHRTLHPSVSESGADVGAELERCRSEIATLTARLGRLEARQKRREEKAS